VLCEKNEFVIRNNAYVCGYPSSSTAIQRIRFPSLFLSLVARMSPQRLPSDNRE
jgi:hypothetical protein